MAKVRLDKFVASQSDLSRKDARIAIWQGRVCVDGQAVTKPDTAIDTNSAVTLDEKELTYKQYVYFMLNKPAGIVSATRDKSAKTVLDLLPEGYKKFQCSPVGRLDKDTTGLLLITNDGDFLHRVISPNKHIEKSYIASLDGRLQPEMITEFADGVVLADGEKCRPAKLELMGDCQARVIITEGKYHQIKRMFGTVGLGVVKLHRERIGGLTLDKNLSGGEIMEISYEQVCRVFE